MNDGPTPTRQGLLSLLPLVLFLLFYLGGSLAIGDFYRIPMTVAFLLTSALAVAVSKGKLNKRVAYFSSGAGDKNILLMVWIYILAGAFAAVAKQMGAVDATVALTLRILPANLVYVALFLAAAFVSLAIGTSVGTVVALTPIAAGVATQLGVSVPQLTAIVLGGAYFGDNLSFISDTTIAATQTQGCRMADKFRLNIRIVWPAFLFMIIYCAVCGYNLNATPSLAPIDFVGVVPYATVIGLSIVGINVLVVLLFGLFLAFSIGIVSLRTTFWQSLHTLSDGISSMGELIVIALLAGGMLELIRRNGGIRIIMSLFSKKIRGTRGAELAIAALVALANVCTANNTVAIITVGRIAHEISSRYHVDPRKAASILDTISCSVQGILPYGVQMLLAAKLSASTPLDILVHLYYPLLIAICMLVSIWIRRPKLAHVC